MWLSASISISELMAGAYVASLGLKHGLAAILLGHLIGGALLYLCGRIGGEGKCSSVKAAACSLGTQGARLFAGMNILQLIAWSAILLRVSAQALTTLSSGLFPTWAWCLLLGLSMMAWIFAGGAEMSRLNLLGSALLLVLTCVMCQQVLQYGVGIELIRLVVPKTNFGTAVELSVALPLSWIPLAADYSSKTAQPHPANCLGTLVYLLGSTWMYAVGLLVALYCGSTHIILLFLRTGIIRVLLLIVVLSTITTVFMKACAAGVGAQVFSRRYSIRFFALAFLIAATAASLLVTQGHYDQFLLLLASILSPLATILITDYFFLKKRETTQLLDLGTMLLWAVGFVLYWLLMSLHCFIGCTAPLFLLLGVIRFVTEKVRGVE
jgi:putative hydroxymethylpyrimidine transporter CytX